ncbi:MAG TPA: Uma2 family endonuclease [Pirellulales bacterium]|nr:Uma2 family endonuclease [Pirellulales bacterium]
MAIAITETLSPRPVPAEDIPPLEQGDRLTRVEFERRYAAMPDLKKAELIEGRVYMPSPVTSGHSGPHSDIVTWLGYYRAATPVFLPGGNNGSVRFDGDNEPQPDAALCIDPVYGGQARIDEDDYFAGPPEFVAEVAKSTVNYDLHDKLQVYRRHGVCEYLVLRVRDAQLDWFRLVDGRYQPIQPDAAGILKSSVLPGLWLDPTAMLKGDLARVFAVLQEGIASPEHAKFLAALQARRAT